MHLKNVFNFSVEMNVSTFGFIKLLGLVLGCKPRLKYITDGLLYAMVCKKCHLLISSNKIGSFQIARLVCTEKKVC